MMGEKEVEGGIHSVMYKEVEIDRTLSSAFNETMGVSGTKWFKAVTEENKRLKIVIGAKANHAANAGESC
jgi:hypothetical protein